jgi:hypothetical protein
MKGQRLLFSCVPQHWLLLLQHAFAINDGTWKLPALNQPCVFFGQLARDQVIAWMTQIRPNADYGSCTTTECSFGLRMFSFHGPG